MSIRRIVTVFATAMLLVCVMVGSALACDCGEKHKTYGANPNANTTLITTAQKQLRTLGYNFKANDGVLNSSMAAALKAFQYDAHLPRTGKLTDCTLYRLESRSKAVKNNKAATKWTTLFNGNYRLLQKGVSSGDRVKTLNNALVKLGFGTSKMQNSTTYSNDTYQAVIAFQKKYVTSHPADGKAGPYTLSALERVYGLKFGNK